MGGQSHWLGKRGVRDERGGLELKATFFPSLVSFVPPRRKDLFFSLYTGIRIDDADRPPGLKTLA